MTAGPEAYFGSLEADEVFFLSEPDAYAELLNKLCDTVHIPENGLLITTLKISSIIIDTPVLKFVLVYKDFSTLETSKSPDLVHLRPQLLKRLAEFFCRA